MFRPLLVMVCALSLVMQSAQPASAAIVTGAENFRIWTGIPFGSLGQSLLFWDQAGPSTVAWFVIRYTEQFPQGELLHPNSLPGDPPAWPAVFTGITDPNLPGPGPVCYVVVPIDAKATPLGHSDLLCKVTGLAREIFPANFGITLGQTRTATVSWDYYQGITGMIVMSSTGETQVVTWPTRTVSFALTAGTCFEGFALIGETVVGNTEVVCGVPDMFETFPPAQTLAQLTQAAQVLGR